MLFCWNSIMRHLPFFPHALLFIHFIVIPLMSDCARLFIFHFTLTFEDCSERLHVVRLRDSRTMQD